MNKKLLSYSILELANVAAGGTIQQTLNDSVAVAQLADTPEEAVRLYTAHIRMFLGVLTGKHKGVQAPSDMTPDLRELMKHPALEQMIRYSFVGTKATVKPQLEAFVKETGVDELITVSIMCSVADRLKSVRLFAELMEEINT